MEWSPASVVRWLFDSEGGASGRLIPRWIVLRGLGLIYFSAFFSLLFQVRGLIGPQGILPAGRYLAAIEHSRLWLAPTLLWISSGSPMLLTICWVGMAASVLLVFNLWPRSTLFISFVCFLSFVAAAGDFSGYQSDGMLLEAGFIAMFFAPPGLRPGFARTSLPSRASLVLLLWEWFRIYFESGVVKLASGETQWRNFTAMDEYYQNGPLPTWIGWYVQHLPHWVHAACAFSTLALELAIVFMMFLPRRARITCFFIVTPWQIGIILTANYTFLNYLVLLLGFLLLDDRFLARLLPHRWRGQTDDIAFERAPDEPTLLKSLKLSLVSVMLGWIFYASTAQLVWMLWPKAPLPTSAVVALDPFRIANSYGLFAVMTRGRYEIEFQGSQDGKTWTAYPFRYKPQDIHQAPRIYAPYQPRFDWNLWFASLGSWREYPIAVNTEVRLLENSPDVLALFAGNPFPDGPPREVRAVIWQYWFTTAEEERTEGTWWRRKLLGLYAPVLERTADGTIRFDESAEFPEREP